MKNQVAHAHKPEKSPMHARLTRFITTTVYPHRWLIAVLLPVLLAALPILLYPMGRDQGMYANIGRSILGGQTPFIDMWDIKPPPIYYIYAAGLALFGYSTEAVRAIDLTLIPVGMIGLYAFGQALENKRTGVLAACLYGVFYFNEDFPSLSQNDGLVTVPMIWAAYAALKAGQSSVDSGGWRWALLSGILCGGVLWFKHYFLFFVMALVGYHLWTRTRSLRTYRSDLSKEAAAFAAGGLLSGGTLLIYTWSTGMFQEMLIVAQGTAAYNAQGYNPATFVRDMLRFLGFKWLVWGPLMVLAALWLPARWLNGARAKGWSLVVVWWLAGVAFLLIQAKGFDTHWIPMLPALALFGADALDRIIQATAQRSYVRFGLYALSVIALSGILAGTTWGRSWWYISGQESRVAYYDRFQANDLKPDESLRVANYLRERVAPGDTLFIWGFRPEVTFMANLRPATRFQAHFPLVADWYPPEWKQNNVDILWAALPPYALVLEDDYMPWVTDRADDSHQLLQEYTELNNWLIANYERIDETGDFIIWQRQTSP
jgi:hypothetical protein